MCWKRKKNVEQERLTSNFVDRENDLKECKKFIKNQTDDSVLFITASKNSGLTFFLKKLYEDEVFCDAKRPFDIYFTSKSSEETFSESLLSNIIEQQQSFKFAVAQKNLIIFILKNLISLGLPFLYLISNTSNIGFSVSDSLNYLLSNEIPTETTIGNKIIKFFDKKKKASIIIVDSADKMSETDLELIRKLSKLNVKFVFAMQNEDELGQKKFFLQAFCDKKVKHKSYKFNSPNEEMFQILCNKYNIDYDDECKQKLLSMNGNIIKIISYFLEDMNSKLSDIEKYMLSFVFYGKNVLNKDLLMQCLNLKISRDNKYNQLTKVNYENILEKLMKKQLININSEFLETNITQDDLAIDIIALRSQICEVLCANINVCNTRQYNFLIKHEHQLQIKIKAVLLASKQLLIKKENIPPSYALILKDNLLGIENFELKEKCEIILVLYYLKQFEYNSAFQVLKNSSRKSRTLQTLFAYTLNRIQSLELAEEALKLLISTSNDTDELAILCSILAITFIHQNKINLALDMYNNKTKNKWDFENFKASPKQAYFLRSIAYYINDEQESEFCFKQICKLGKFNNNNYFMFTTKNNLFARRLASKSVISNEFIADLETLSNEIPHYELRLYYNNVGIHYLQRDRNTSFEAFQKVFYLSKAKNDLPYLFAKINCAIMHAYYNEFDDAQNIFDEIEETINGVKLTKIKSSYYLALLLFNYMQGKDLTTHIKNVEKHPIKKLNFDSDEYIDKIKSLYDKRNNYTAELFPSIFIKNVTFYWYIDPIDLLSDVEMLSF